MTLTDWTAQKEPEVRIEHKWGHGDWHSATARRSLQAECNRLHVLYPDGNHYVAEQP